MFFNYQFPNWNLKCICQTLALINPYSSISSYSYLYSREGLHGLFEDFNLTELIYSSRMLPASTGSDAFPPPLMVPLTLIHGADAKGA
ncbi:hypothetical protein FRX31_034345, partial [Thalictrum thalictroides]